GNEAGVVGAVYFDGSIGVVDGSRFTLLNSTVVGNTVLDEGPGGLGVLHTVQFEARNSIIAGNVDGPDYAGPHYGDLDINDDVSGSIDFTLVQDPSSNADPLF